MLQKVGMLEGSTFFLLYNLLSVAKGPSGVILYSVGVEVGRYDH